jgi:hypothetical protein
VVLAAIGPSLFALGVISINHTWNNSSNDDSRHNTSSKEKQRASGTVVNIAYL